MGYNKLILEGHLTRDIEMKYTQAGAAIANTAIAVSRKFKAQTGEQKEEVLFVDLAFFGRTAEIANQFLRKGSHVLVDGRLKLDQWTAQDGQKRSKHAMTVENLQMLGNKDQQPGQGHPAPAYNQPAPGQTAPAYGQPAPQANQPAAYGQPAPQPGYNPSPAGQPAPAYNPPTSGQPAPQPGAHQPPPGPGQPHPGQPHGQPGQPQPGQAQAQPGQPGQPTYGYAPNGAPIVNEDEIPF